MKRRVDGFVIGMAAAVALAWWFPDPGASGGVLRPELTSKAAVALIFFLHGLTLSFAALRAGTLLWRVHLVVQSATFVAFPLVGLAFFWVSQGRLEPTLRTGLFYLCALPSTVSSSVALTAVARGNVPAAVFNATLSSLLGVLLTPLWLELVLGAGGASLPFLDVVLDLARWLLLPLVAGQLLRPLLGAFASRHRAKIAVVDRFTILLLVYTSFCDSVKSGVWLASGVTAVLITLAFSVALLLGALCGLDLCGRALGFSREDRIAAVFCGSKKTLASGVPMARLIFGAHPGLALILLPILIYHALQLLVCGWLAGRWSREGE